MDLLTVALLVAGLALLLLGAEALVRGASHLAAVVRIPPLVVGLTVVAFGTSAPELAVSVSSAFSGTADLGLGNVVGSNIFNILFILGATAVVAPLVVQERLVRIDVPLMIGLSVLVLLLGIDGRIGRVDGVLLAAGAVAYTVLLIRHGRRTAPQQAKAPVARGRPWALDLLLIAGGLGLLVLGSRWLVGGAVAVARVLGVSELIIGLTVVAAGTSLPEVATSLMAALRGERELAVGNVVGSNVLNLLSVLGFTAAVAPDGIPVPAAALAFDLPVMVAVAVACLPIFFTGMRIRRWEGALFLAYYGAYTAYLVLEATRHAALTGFSRVMAFFVVPLTALTLGGLALRTLLARRAAARSRSRRAAQ